MASRKPDLHVPMPQGQAVTVQSSQSSIRSPRSPRFREVFDAPFSEALMNTSRTTLATDSSGSCPSSQRRSIEAERKRRTSYDTVRTKSQSQAPAPVQWRQDSWASSDSTRRFSVNERIREWARRSFAFSRKNSDQSDEGYFSQVQSQASSKPAAATPASEGSTFDATSASGQCRTPAAAATDVNRPR